jgi:transcriptional regulator with XRE-family HTH domain
MDFRSRLAALRDEKGLNNKSLSLNAGLSETVVRDILQRNKTEPRLDTVKKLAKALGVSVIHLIGEDIQKTSENTTITLHNGDVAEYIPFSEWVNDVKPVINGLRVIVRFDTIAKLCVLDSIGSQELFVPLSLGKEGKSITYQPDGPLDTGTAEVNGQVCNYRILGIFRKLVVFDNS